jgi:putative hemolysin
MIIVTLILSYLTLVFGELVPKRIALQQSERIALFTVKPIYIISKFTKPFIKLLSFSTSIVLQILGVEDDDIELKISKEEIKSLISKCQEDGFIDTCEQDMINSVFEFKSKSIREIMTPRNNMFAIDIEEDNEKIIDQVLNSPFSRIPVYKDTNDNIIGILYIKDVFIEARKVGFDKVDIESILQQPNFVLETIKTNELFNMLKTKKVHLAILFDEYGSISGLVSMEDLIEEIVGDIEDEYDPEANTIKKLDNDKFIVKGYLSVSEFNNKFNVLLDEGDYDTLNGYILNQLGTLPEEGTIIETNDIRFKVITVNNRRIEDIEITNINKE